MTILPVMMIGLMAVFGGQVASYAQVAEASGTGTVAASGSSTARLDGRGSYTVGDTTGAWLEASVVVNF